MKFVLVLIIFFVGENNPNIYRYIYVDFIDENTCLLFKEQQGKLLQESISNQFKYKDIDYQEIQCWTLEQWLEEDKRIRRGVEA
jgi:hypothetical protein